MPPSAGHETLHLGHASHPAPETRKSPTRRTQKSQRALTNAFHIAPSTGASHSFGYASAMRSQPCHCFLSSAARIPARLSSQLIQELPCHRRHYLRQCWVRLFSCIWPFRRIRSSFRSIVLADHTLAQDQFFRLCVAITTHFGQGSIICSGARLDPLHHFATISFTFSFSSVSVTASHPSAASVAAPCWNCTNSPHSYPPPGEYTLQTSPYVGAQRSHESAPAP